MSDLAGWLDRLADNTPAGFELGLERISRVVATLGLAPTVPVISVAGTNGKGSICAYLEAILNAAGYRPACFYSPHLLDFSERLRHGGHAVPAADLVAQFKTIAAADATRPAGTKPLSYFEYLAVTAVRAGEAAGCGAHVLEVGLGGRLDAVNVYAADVAVIASVGIDHVDHLGPDRESIGAEKAGIARPARPLVIGDLRPPASVLAVAARLAAPVKLRGRDFHVEVLGNSWTYRGDKVRGALPRPAMLGNHQLGNAATALAALECLSDRLPVSQAEVREGLHEARLPGRCQVVGGPVPVVLDVAHNVPAAQVLANTLLDMGYYPNTHFVIGVRSRKDAAGIVTALAGRADCWHVAPLAGNRGVIPVALRTALAATDAPVHEYPTIGAAAAGARMAVPAPERMVVCGSFLTVEGYLLSQRECNKAA